MIINSGSWDTLTAGAYMFEVRNLIELRQCDTCLDIHLTDFVI